MTPSDKEWFSNCGSWSPCHSLEELRAGIAAGLLDRQDESGMTALCLATSSGWITGVEELLRAGADTRLRYFRTGETALRIAVQEQNIPIIEALIAGGANPDAANHWGITPRTWSAELFTHVPPQEVEFPELRIQNAEHLADHYHPRFKIPDREEREGLQPGQAVDLYVYGPKCETKQDTVKVRITARRVDGSTIRYTATLETPVEQTHLPTGTTEVEFGPEHVASVYVVREPKIRNRKSK